MNKILGEHLKGIKIDLKFILPKYKLSKKAQEKLSAEIVDMVEQKMLIAYSQGAYRAEINEQKFLFSRVHRPLIEQLQVMKDDRDFS